MAYAQNLVHLEILNAYRVRAGLERLAEWTKTKAEMAAVIAGLQMADPCFDAPEYARHLRLNDKTRR